MNDKPLKFNLSTTAAHKVDVMFLADATGSMRTSLKDVKKNIISSFNQFKNTSTWDIELGIAFYRDSTDAVPFQVLQTITGDEKSIQNAANELSPIGGGDRPEAQMAALTQLASPRTIAGWRPGATRIIAWFGDEPGHNPVTVNGVTYTEAGAYDALLEYNVQVCAFSMAPTNNLDEVLPGQTYGQATKVTSEADGLTPIGNKYVMSNVRQTGVVATILNFIGADTP